MNPKFQGPDFDRFCTHHPASSILPCFSAGGWFNMINFTQSSKIPWSHTVNHWMLSVNMTGARCIKMLPATAADALDGGRMIPELQISRRVKNGNSSMQISVALQGFLMLFAGHSLSSTCTRKGNQSIQKFLQIPASCREFSSSSPAFGLVQADFLPRLVILVS